MPGKILIIDDLPDDLACMEQILKKEGYKVETAPDGGGTTENR